MWDKLTDGTFVTDFRVGTPSKTGYSAPCPAAVPVPGDGRSGLTEHTGPGVSSPATGALPGGALGWVVCQQAGSGGGTPGLGQAPTATGCPDNYVATPSAAYTASAPRC